MDGGDPEGQPGPWAGGGEGRHHPYWIPLNRTVQTCNNREDLTDFYASERLKPACYAHAWDPSANRIFAAGGPISYRNSGCYVAVWT